MRSLPLAIFLLLALPALAWSQDVPQQAVRHYQKAIKASHKRKNGKALTRLDKALAISPHFHAARSMRADLHEQQGDHVRALADVEQCLLADPHNYAHRMHHAALCRLAGTPLLGLPDLDTLLAHTEMSMEQRLEVQCMRAALVADGGTVKDALKELSAAIKQKPAWGEGYLLRAQLEEQIRDLDNARADYDRAVELMTAKQRALFGRARFHHHHGAKAQACADLAAAEAAGFLPSPNEATEYQAIQKNCSE